MIKLQQGQVWKAGDGYVRIVDLQRLEVKYKAMRDLTTREGTHHHVSKKEFCRLLKQATLLSPEQVKDMAESLPAGQSENVSSDQP